MEKAVEEKGVHAGGEAGCFGARAAMTKGGGCREGPEVTRRELRLGCRRLR